MLFVGWWVLLSGAATVVLVVVDRLARRLLPLAALFKLSLVFPDQAPSRFRTAMRSRTVESLEQQVARARAGEAENTPVTAAEHLLALVARLDSHDRLTRGHADRVRAYAQMIGEELRLESKDIELLNWAALLHDIGKLGVPTEILTKQGLPTSSDWLALRRHPEHGEALVAPLRGWLGAWADAVGQHHERWDGRGYPRGKAGDDITLAARIVAVADVFDVITSARSYKSAASTTRAREEISRCAGKQLDPRAVRAFLSVGLGRLRFAMGPLSWLAHLPILGRIPFTSAIGTVSSSLAAVTVAATTGLVGSAPGPVSAAPSRAPAAEARTAVLAASFAAPSISRSIEEDQSVFVRIEGITGVDSVATLRIIAAPSAGTARVTAVGAIHYTPPPGFDGTIEIRYEACLGTGECATGVVRIDVYPVNDAPDAEDDSARTLEDEPVTIAVLANDSDPDEDIVFVSHVAGEDHGVPTIVAGGIEWTPARDFAGTATFRYMIEDLNGGTAAARVRIVVAPEASPPSATPGEPAAVAPPTEDLAPDSKPGTDEPAPEEPAGDPGETPVRLPPAAPPAAEPLPAAVAPVNQAPSFTAGPDQQIPEDAGPRTVTGWATEIAPGPPAESPQSISFLVSSDDANLFTASGQPAVAPDGTLTFTPAANVSGTASITVRAKDDGGTAGGGVDTSEARTFEIAVVAINDAPSFEAGADQLVPEDSGPQTVPAWAAAVSPGPGDESSQSIAFLVSTSDPGLFTPGGRPAVAANGTLSYTPEANLSGNATVSVRAKDGGGTNGGGVDTSEAQTFTIRVVEAADDPIANDDGVSASEDDPAGVTFDVLGNDTDGDLGDALSVASYDDSTLVSGILTWIGGGSFTYIPDQSFSGTETFSYTVEDGAGGTDTATVTIMVAPAPDAPEASNNAYSTSQDTALVIAPPGVLGNDGDEDGDALTVWTTPIGAPSNGTLVLAADGSFTYTPTGGFSGTDAFTYRADDGTGLTDDAVVTITVSSSLSSGVLYLASTGSSTEVWDMTAVPPAPATPVPDYDSDSGQGSRSITAAATRTTTARRTFRSGRTHRSRHSF